MAIQCHVEPFMRLPHVLPADSWAVHTVAVDLQTHRLYTPQQEEDGKPVARTVVYDAVGDR